ncbi:MAG: TlpA family protein disulfide reductase [Ideonella sp.]|nr:TlpA family protein disulfide reductase [Ideonella sp.]
MNRRQTLALGAVAALAAAAGTGVGVWRQPGPTQGAEAVGQLPPDFWQLRFTKPDGGELAMADFRGQPLVINFWATWCPPCVRELPALEAFAREQRGTGGVRVLGLAVDAAAPVKAFIQREGIQLPVAIAGLEGSELARQLGNAQGGLPFTVLLAADGRLAQSRLGETSRVELSRWANALGTLQK